MATALEGSRASAFEACWKGLYLPLVAYAYQRLQDHHLAENLVQEAFMRLWKYQHRVDWSRVSGWLYQVLRNLIVDHYRLHRTDALAYTLPLETGRSNPDYRRWIDPVAALLDRELEEQLQAALEELPPTYRETLALRLSGLHYSEIAEVQGVPVGTVRSRLHYARTRLPRLLPAEFPAAGRCAGC